MQALIVVALLFALLPFWPAQQERIESRARHYLSGPQRRLKREGLWTQLYPSGRPHLRGKFHDDRQDGVWNCFTDEDGPRTRTVRYVDGEQQP